MALARCVAHAPAALLLLAAIDWAFPLPIPLLFPAVAALGAWFTVDAVRYFAARRCRSRSPADAAIEIEAEKQGALDNILIGALQLGEEALQGGEEQNPAAGRHSMRLVEALLAKSAETASAISSEPAPRPRGWRTACASAIAVAALWLGFVLGARSAAAARWARVADSWNVAVEALFPVELVATPGSVNLLRGSAVELSVEARGARRDSIEFATVGPDGETLESRTLPLEKRRAVFSMDSVEEDFRYVFRYGRRLSGPFEVRVGDRPTIQAINYELTYPAYTGQMPRTLTGIQSKLQAIAGTSVLVSFAATTELHPDLSYVEWADGTRQQVSVNGRFGHFAFAITQADTATLRLASRLGKGFEMAEPRTLDIAVVRDRAPQVRIAIRGGHAAMLADQAAAMAVPYVAEDDFGVAEVRLEYKIEAVDDMLGRAAREGVLTRAIDPASDRVVGRFPDPFAELDPPLGPGDKIKIEVVASDNNSETGPGLARSAPFEIVVVQNDLGAYAEARLGFGASSALLKGLKRVQRNTNLLVEPEKTVHTEDKVEIESHALDARNSPDSWPAGSEDAIGDYFRLLSGGGML